MPASIASVFVNAAEAALEAARIGMTATIVVGILATIGTITGTVLAPFLVRIYDDRRAKRDSRRDALAEVIPLLIRDGMRAAHPQAKFDYFAALVETQARFAVLLGPDEWQVVRIAEAGLLAPKSTKSASEAAQLIPAWFRGEISPAVAAELYEARTGETLENRLSSIS